MRVPLFGGSEVFFVWQIDSQACYRLIRLIVLVLVVLREGSGREGGEGERVLHLEDFVSVSISSVLDIADD